MDFSNKTAVVTGAGSGIGKSIAERFVEHDTNVGVVDIDEESISKTTSELMDSKFIGDVFPVVADVSKPGDVEVLIKEVSEKFGSIDILINNTGISHGYSDVDSIDVTTWNDVLAVNLKGPILCSKFAAPHIREQEGGVIINTLSSVATGTGVKTGLAAYASSKGGLIALTKQLALDLARDNIRVNAISPSGTDTPLKKERIHENGSTQPLSGTPFGEVQSASVVAGVAVLLASDDAAVVTGTILPIGHLT